MLILGVLLLAFAPPQFHANVLPAMPDAHGGDAQPLADELPEYIPRCAQMITYKVQGHSLAARKVVTSFACLAARGTFGIDSGSGKRGSDSLSTGEFTASSAGQRRYRLKCALQCIQY